MPWRCTCRGSLSPPHFKWEGLPWLGKSTTTTVVAISVVIINNRSIVTIVNRCRFANADAKITNRTAAGVEVDVTAALSLKAARNGCSMPVATVSARMSAGFVGADKEVFCRA